LRALFASLRELRIGGLLLAYHDRRTAGVLMTLLEMACKACRHCGLPSTLT